jgi:hypothetical protein
MAKVDSKDRAFVDVFCGIGKGTMTDQEAIVLLVKSGLSENAEDAKIVIMDFREIHFAGSLPPDSEMDI